MRTVRASKKMQGSIVLAIAFVLTVGGTFAWFSTSDQVENVFGMDAFDVKITEAFDDVPVIPGANITKEVKVQNFGNIPTVIRMKLEET